jgi:hypothetical protein
MHISGIYGRRMSFSEIKRGKNEKGIREVKKVKTKKLRFVDTNIRESIAELVSKQDHKTLVLWATDCAEHVLHYFEEKQLKDKRPRKAIEAGRAWVRGEITVSEVRTAALAAHAAARNTNDTAARAAARAAGQAAATAHVAGHAVHAATYAAKAVSFFSKDENSQVKTAKERNWQYRHLQRIGNKH